MAEARPSPSTTAADGRVRAVIDAVYPSVDGGRFPVKRVSGERMVVEADCFTDGHDALRVMLRWRTEEAPDWREVEMAPLGNDRWRAGFVVGNPGRCRYTVTAWVDHFLSWRNEFARRREAEDIVIAAQVGAHLSRRPRRGRSPPIASRFKPGWHACAQSRT